MADGFRKLLINTQERAVSSDINRLQSFMHQDVAEFLRYFLNAGTTEADPGYFAEPSSLGTPLKAEVINGLMVKPQAGSFSLFVDAGLLLAMVADGASEESAYKYARSTGVSTLGQLVIGANASGSIRIDVIECRVNPVEGTVSDNRDVFNATTGLFAASSVTKETFGRLEFRVRAGTAGSGYPTAQSGWLPLCIASVPSGAASNNDVTFWDVRPLLADRAAGPMDHQLDDGLVSIDARCERVDSSNVNLAGFAKAIVKGRRVGGRIRNSVPGTSADLLNLAAAANQDTGTIAEPFGTDGTVFVYLATPFGLPRWSRYTDGPSGRVPRAPKGILVISATLPDYDGKPQAALAMPAGTGLGAGTTTDAVCVYLHTYFATTTEFVGKSWGSGRTIMGFGPMVQIQGTYNVISASACDFHPVEREWPKNAKAVMAELSVGLTVAANTHAVPVRIVRVYGDNAGAGDQNLVDMGPLPITRLSGAGSGAYDVSTGLCRLQAPYVPPGGTPRPTPFLIQYQLASGLTVGTSYFEVYGFEL